MAKAQDMSKPIVIRSTIDLHTKDVLEKWTKLTGRSEQSHSGALIQRLIRLYEKNPQILVDLGLMSKSEHPVLAEKLHAMVA